MPGWMAARRVTVLDVSRSSPLLTWVLKPYLSPTARGFCALNGVRLVHSPGTLFFLTELLEADSTVPPSRPSGSLAPVTSCGLAVI